MPVIEPPKRKTAWPQIIGFTCGGCAVLAVIVGIVGYFWVSRQVSSFVNQLANPTPPSMKDAASFKFMYNGKAATCSLRLPDGYGDLTYSHLLSGTFYCWGERAVKVTRKTGKSREWPLPYSPLTKVKVGVYWYAEKNGEGPFLRFYDATGSSILDLKTGKIGRLEQNGGNYYFSYYAYNDGNFYSSGLAVTTDDKGRVISVEDEKGNPAPKASAAISSNNCTYLGSIIRKGCSLVFRANQKAKERQP